MKDLPHETALQLGSLVRGPGTEFDAEFEREAETRELQSMQGIGQGLALARRIIVDNQDMTGLNHEEFS